MCMVGVVGCVKILLYTLLFHMEVHSSSFLFVLWVCFLYAILLWHEGLGLKDLCLYISVCFL
jgi:hypothetical protein